jgi:hypothetical protein
MDGAWRQMRYNSYSFLGVKEEVSGQHHAPAAIYLQGKDARNPLHRRSGGPKS